MDKAGQITPLVLLLGGFLKAPDQLHAVIHIVMELFV
jgi:hypothetical protein